MSTLNRSSSLDISSPADAHRILAKRRLPIGAEVIAGEGVHFRVWADRHRRVEVVLCSRRSHEPTAVFPLRPEGNGYFSALIAEVRTGDLYGYRLDGEPEMRADPASRFQPQGPFGPSQVIDPSTFPWTDEAWPGIGLEGQVLYEMHVGTLTREGTFAAAAAELAELAALGITVIELMPLADFPGRFGWGYDGVNLFAPTRLYGAPDELRRFVDRAHALGLGVILDVVYNHLGPEGQPLSFFSENYFTDRYTTEWGKAINYDGENAGPVREYFLANAGYWIDEFHLDGLRLDATQSIFDSSEEHILTALGRRVRQAAGRRSTLLVAENEPQHTRLVLPLEQGGYGLDTLWNDDFHHSAMVALSGHNEAYYSDHLGRPQEFISAIKWGSLFQGQHYQWQGKRRGTPAFGLPPARFVVFLQNHDQVANSARGWRCHRLTSPGRYRALTALMLLAPGTPMLFQGQEFAASSPFLYFADHQPELAAIVRQGRHDFLAQFPSIATPEMASHLARPDAPGTFVQSKLDLSERKSHAEAYALHGDLLRLRREDAAFRAQRPGGVDGAVLGDEALVLRYFVEEGDDRLLVINLGRDLHLAPVPEPLLAPPEGKRWQIRWSSEDPAYGGGGTPPLESEAGWRIPGHAAVVLMPAAAEE